MYGTVARIKVKPGREADFLAFGRSEETLNIPGFLGQFVYHLDRDPNEYMLVIVFRDDDSYFKNADSPEQEERYHQMREMLAEDPEWFDGEIAHAWIKDSDVWAEADLDEVWKEADLAGEDWEEMEEPDAYEDLYEAEELDELAIESPNGQGRNSLR